MWPGFPSIHPSLSAHPWGQQDVYNLPKRYDLWILNSPQGLSWGLLLVGHAKNTSPGTRPGGILIPEPPQLSPISVEELYWNGWILILFLREIPASPWMKLMSSTCICDLELLVTTQTLLSCMGPLPCGPTNHMRSCRGLVLWAPGNKILG